MAAGDDWRQVAARLDDVPAQWVKAGAQVLRARLLAALVADVGGDRRMSGVGARLNVTATTSLGISRSDAEVAAGPRRTRGPWFWLEEGTGPGRPQGGSSPAKRTWSRTVDPLLAAIEHDLERRFRSAVR